MTATTATHQEYDGAVIEGAGVIARPMTLTILDGVPLYVEWTKVDNDGTSFLYLAPFARVIHLWTAEP